jgi:hypothetical protein
MLDAIAAITTPRSSAATTASGFGLMFAMRAADHSDLAKSIINDLDLPRSVIGTTPSVATTTRTRSARAASTKSPVR